jgi:hypothetical protein
MELDKLQASDVWFWAKNNKIQLGAGEFRLKGHEYLIEPLRCRTRRRCTLKGSQLGFTESEVLRTLHGMIHKLYPQGVLYLFPTATDVQDFSRARFSPLIINNWDSIGRFVQSTDAATIKRINDATLYFRGARAGYKVEGIAKDSSSLKSIPVDKIVLDESDLMDDLMKQLAEERMAHSEVMERCDISTPTIPDYGIDKLWQVCSQGYWHIKCQHCGTFTCLEEEFPSCIEVDEQGNGHRLCKKCKREIHPRHGQYVHKKPELYNELVGWHISQLNSMYVNPAKILRAFENPPNGRLQVVYNSMLGRPYISAENRMTPADVYGACGGDFMPTSHAGCSAMGVDIGSKIHVVIGGRPNVRNLEITKVAIVDNWSDVHDLAKRYNVTSCVIDHFPEKHKAEEFARTEPYEIFLAEYQEQLSSGSDWRYDDRIVKVDRTTILDEVHFAFTEYGRMKIPRKSPDIEEYARQMCNTAKVIKTDEESGLTKAVYIKLNDADHFRHATGYFMLAAKRIGLFSAARQAPRPQTAKDFDPFEV